MNIHPAFVHFPIALLFCYALIELLPLARFFPAVPWNPIRRFLLYVGSLSLIPTVITGLIAAGGLETPAIEAHERAGLTTTLIFLAAAAIVYFASPESWLQRVGVKVLALLGLLMLFVTGALGANMVYGPDVDPIVSLVVRLFGL